MHVHEHTHIHRQCFSFLESEASPLDERRSMAVFVSNADTYLRSSSEGVPSTSASTVDSPLHQALSAAISNIRARQRPEDVDKETSGESPAGSPAKLPATTAVGGGPRMLLSFLFDKTSRGAILPHCGELLSVLCAEGTDADVRKSCSEVLSMLLDYADSRGSVRAAMSEIDLKDGGDNAKHGAPWVPFLLKKATAATYQ